VAGQAQYARDVAEYQEQMRAAESANAEQWQRSSKAYDELAAENPDINNRLDEIAQLAVESGITPDLMLNPETMRGTLGPLHEAARQIDPDVVGSPAWAAAQQAALMNAGGVRLKNEADRKRFIEKLPEGMYLDANDQVVIAPRINEEAIVGAATLKPTTQTAWEQAERERIFGPDRDRSNAFHDQVRAAAAKGTPGARIGRLPGAKPRDKATGQFTSKEVAGAEQEPAGEQAAAVEATAPAPARQTAWDAYPTRPNPGQWWD
jgi:hypothetical protein